MKNFKEDANQFLKENYGIEDFLTLETPKESVLKFFEFLENRNVDLKNNSEKLISMVVQDLVSTDIKKTVDIILFCSILECESWNYCLANPSYCSIPDIEELVRKREDELSDLYSKDKEEYVKRFGDSRRSVENELKYCLQDIEKDLILSTQCFEYVVESCMSVIFNEHNLVGISTVIDLEELLNIIYR